MQVERLYNIEVPTSPLNEIRCVCFHPSERSVCIAILNELRVVDLATCSTIAKLSLEERIGFVGINPSHNLLVVCTTEGSIHAWQYATFSPVISFLSRKEKDRRLTACWCFATAIADPYACYSRQGSREIYVFNLMSKGVPMKLDAKKSVVDLGFHPSKTLMGALTSDGIIRLWDYLTGDLFGTTDDFVKIQTQQQRTHSSVLFLIFHPTENLIVAASENGVVVGWHIGTGITLLGSGVHDKKIAGIQFHPYYRSLFLHHTDGTLTTMSWGGKKEYFYTIEWFDTVNISDMELRGRFPEIFQIGNSALEANRLVFHPSYNYFSFVFSRQQIGSIVSLSNSISCLRLGVYSLTPKEAHDSEVKVSAAALPHNGFFSRERSVFEYPSTFSFVSHDSLYAYNLATNETYMLRKLPDNMFGNVLRITSMLKSAVYRRYVIFYEITPANLPPDYCFAIVSEKPGDTPSFLRGRGGQWVGKRQNKSFGVLSESGSSFEIRSIFNGSLESEVSFTEVVSQVFSHPDGVMFQIGRKLLVADENARIDSSRSFELEEGEDLLQVNWQLSENEDSSLNLLAAISNKRLLILSSDLKTICTILVSSRASPFSSCFWVDNALLFTTEYQLNYLTLDGAIHRLCSLKDAAAHICAVLNDRVIYAVPFKGTVKIRWHAIGLLQPLLIAQLALSKPYKLEEADERARFQRIISRFDNVRITNRLISLLDKHNHPDIAYALISQSPFYSPAKKIDLALNSHQFDTAFDLLTDWVTSSNKERQRETGKPTTELEESVLEKVKDVANTYLHFGQFELARKTLLLGPLDMELLYLFVITKNKRGIESIVSRLKSSTDPAKKLVLFACEQQLKNGKFPSGSSSTLVNWTFETKQTTNWTTTQVTGATMKTTTQDSRQNTPFITPLGLLDSIAKWLTSSAIDDVPSPLAQIGPGEETDDNDPSSGGNISSSNEDSLRPPAPLLKSSKPKSTSNVTSATKRKIVIEEDSSETSTGISELKEDDFSDEEETGSLGAPSALPTKSPVFGRKKKTRKRSSLLHSGGGIETLEKAFGVSTSEEIRLPTLSKITPFLQQQQQASPITPPASSANQPPASPSSAVHIVEEPRTPPDSERDTFFPGAAVSPVALDPATESINLAKKYLSMSLEKLDQGQFSAALDDINQSIATFLSVSSPDVVQPFVKACLAYKLALRLLIEIKLQEKSKNIQRLALLARLLADIPLRPNHRTICIRFAVNKNVEAENFAVAARFIRMLQNRPNLSDADALELKLKKCLDNLAKKEAAALNTSSGQIPTSSTSSGTPSTPTTPTSSASPSSTSHSSSSGSISPNSTSSSSSSTSSTNSASQAPLQVSGDFNPDSPAPVTRYCFQSFQPLTGKTALIHCPYCDAIYSEKVKKPGEKCVYCNHGVLSRRSPDEAHLIALF